MVNQFFLGYPSGASRFVSSLATLPSDLLS